MSEIPSNWFSNPRPLPLDENGKVDFSEETGRDAENRTEGYLITNPIRGKYALSADMHNRLGSCQEVLLQEGGSIFVAVEMADGKHMSLYDTNHNIFRLDKDGNVVWQVKREERGRVNWDYILGEVAKGDEGNPETIRKAGRPFMGLSQNFVKRGIYLGLGSAPLADEYMSAIWHPDYVLITRSGSEEYELDIETGLATNISQGPGRDW